VVSPNTILWIADNALNGIAYLFLLVAPPMKAQARLKRVASVCPKIVTITEARRAMQRLAAHGTCLSRSLSIAVRCPGARVVIGVGSVSRTLDKRTAPGRRPIDAHAWVEMGGISLLDGAKHWRELGRM
jgi:hypothetical protein